MTLETFLSDCCIRRLIVCGFSMRVMGLSRIMAQITGTLNNTRRVSRKQ